MNVVLLAGGQGSRIQQGPDSPPKAIVEIGGYPILWHVMKIFAARGFGEFVVALGHRGDEIRRYVERRAGLFRGLAVEWADTGETTASAGRIKRLRPHLGASAFLLAFCDGLTDLDITALLHFHRNHGKIATVAAVHPPARFGSLSIEGDRVIDFREKDPGDAGWINGGFFCFEPAVFDLIEGDDTILERHLLTALADKSELMAYRHTGFWQCMDTPAEHLILEKSWQSGQAPWKQG